MRGLEGAIALTVISFVFKVRPLEARTRAGSDTLWQKARSDVGGLVRCVTACRLGEWGVVNLRSGNDSLLDCGLTTLLSIRGL